ncbi:hypothetical protein D8674_005663 [Pyrus ussuriensis x Pyrus communis]|uniref:Uncharacterized protein n=1 Tax=Pyrus ussuriensis x Pyrus communis TaxID=2448454 RepID=A0A5N5FS28_9ROSA|nr:hypothetical protein D8674_005663 [Pyrus ussuriensis x Pyrus communis]
MSILENNVSAIQEARQDLRETTPLLSLKERGVKEITILKETTTKRLRLLDELLTLFGKQGEFEVSQGLKSHATFTLWQTHILPIYPMDALCLMQVSPSELYYNLVNIIAQPSLKVEHIHWDRAFVLVLPHTAGIPRLSLGHPQQGKDCRSFEYGPQLLSTKSILKLLHLSNIEGLLCILGHKPKVPFGTWDGTEQNGTRRSVPRLVCLKLVERAIPRDEFWVNFRSTSPLGRTRSTSVEHKIITSSSPSSSTLFLSEGIFAPAPFCSVLSRPVLSSPVPSRSVPSRPVCIPNDTVLEKQDMAIANLQAQIANLNSQLSQYAKRSTMQSVPTFGVSYRQEYQANQCPQRDQGSQNQTNKAQQGEYWQPYKEFYTMPMQPPQSALQQFQPNLGSSIDCAKILDVLISLTHELQNQAQVMNELKNQIGEIAEFMGQMQEQSELSDSTIEIAEAITLESGMEVGDEPQTSKPSQNMDEQLLLDEEEDNKAMAKEEQPLPQPHMPSISSTTTKVSLNSILPNPIPPNVPIPCRFMQSKEEEGKKGIFETFPKNQEQEVVGECLEFIKEGILETTIPKEVGFYDMGQVITLKTPNLAEFSSPTTFKWVFILEFMSEHTEFKPLPDHFKYHLPFKDHLHAVGTKGAKKEVSFG